jgi:hypothetical protein
VRERVLLPQSGRSSRLRRSACSGAKPDLDAAGGAQDGDQDHSWARLDARQRAPNCLGACARRRYTLANLRTKLVCAPFYGTSLPLSKSMPPPDSTQALAISARAPDRRGRVERRTDTSVRVFNPRDLNQVQRLIGSIPLVTIGNFRDRAIIGLLGYAQASPDEIIGMMVRDYFSIGRHRWIRLAENGIKRNKIVDRRLQDYIDEYLVAAKVSGDPNTPLFRLTEKRGKRLSAEPLSLSSLRDSIRRHLANYYEINIYEQMIVNIKGQKLVDLRDRAIIGMVLYTSAPLEKLCRMRASDYYAVNGQYYAKLYGREPVSVPPALAFLMDDYLAAIRWPTRAHSPLFRASRYRPIVMAEIRELIERRQV